MALDADFPQFTGDPAVDKMQPSEFIRRFNLKTVMMPTIRTEAFPLCLGPTDSVANVWYKSLDPATQASHAITTAAFEARFPDVVKAQQTVEEYQRELFQLKLSEDQVGRKELSGGVETWSHIVFADRMLFLAQKGGIVTTPGQIWQVRDNLPHAIKEKIPTVFPTWTDFATAIRGVPVDHLRDAARAYDEKVKQEKKSDERLAALEAEVRRARMQVPTTTAESPTAPLRSGMRNMRFRDESPTRASRPRATASDSFSDRRPPQSRPPPRTLTGEQLEELKRHVAKQSTVPRKTAEAQADYEKQVKSWFSTYGLDAYARYDRPFPLQPGTAPICTGECYKCGISDGHIWATCSNNAIPETERRWRSYCGTHVGRTYNAVRTRPVNVLAEFPFLSEEEVDQGKE